jgi:pSer/pThr/pTyr-binding forkhead associated (FHA) protein
LKVVSGPGQREGMNVPLSREQPLVIGRKRGDLILEDPLVSGAHAQIRAKDDHWVVQDLGSTNGTMLDGRLIREAVLTPGAELSIGSTVLVLFVGEGAQPGAPRAPAAPRQEVAWLLDDELVEVRGSADRTRGTGDVIDQDLRLPPGLNAVVEVVNGEDTGRVFRFTRGNITIGRKLGEVPLSDLEVSRRHAVIEVFGRDMIFLRDLGSTNGTYHNGRKVGVSALQSGDTIGVGRSVLKLQVKR